MLIFVKCKYHPELVGHAIAETIEDTYSHRPAHCPRCKFAITVGAKTVDRISVFKVGSVVREAGAADVWREVLDS